MGILLGPQRVFPLYSCEGAIRTVVNKREQQPVLVLQHPLELMIKS